MSAKYDLPQERAHSIYGFSQAERYLSCPGTIAACATIPKKPSGPWAALGTAEHSLGEYCLSKNVDAASCIGGWFYDRDATPEMAQRVQPYLDAVREKLRAAGPDAILLVETTVNAASIHPELWGSIDAAIIVPFESAEVIDLKTGVNAVEADCDQGKGYSVCAWLMFDVPKVTFTIIQPNAPHHLGPVRSETYSAAQLREQADRFKAGVEATLVPGAPLAAGSWCKYCPAQPTCPEVHKRTLVAAQMDFQQPTVAPKPPHTLTPAQLRVVLDQADMIVGWIKSVHAYAMDCALAGNPPDGYKLIAGRKGNRKWVNEATVEKALREAGIEPHEQSLISCATAEKTIGKKDFAHLLGDLCTQSPGKPELAPISDARPALAAGAAADFTPVEDDFL